MPRPKKTSKFADYLIALSIDEMKILVREASSEIKSREKAVVKEAEIEKAKKLRDKLKIGDKVTGKATGGNVTGEVIGIFAEKVQIKTSDGKKKSLPFHRIVT